MPSSYTQNYQLNQWAADDQVCRVDFNDDNAKIDAALKALNTAKADKTTVNSLSTTVSKKQDAASAVQIAIGQYAGNGEEQRTISVGFTPKAVLLLEQRGKLGDMEVGTSYGGLALYGYPVRYIKNGKNFPVISITTGGFTVYQTKDGAYNAAYTNAEGWTYNYLAIG